VATLHEYARSMSTVRHVLEKDPAAADRVHVVTSFGDADFVLRSKEFTVLTAEDGYSRDVSDPILGDTLSRVDGPAHFERRRIEAALFRSPTMRANEASVLRPALERALAELGSSQGTGALRADLHHISEQVLGEVVAALIGLDGLDTPEGRAKFDTYYQDIDNGVRITWATENIERLAAMAAAALDRLVEDFVKPAADRRARLLEAVAVGDAEPDAVPTDLITLMLEHHDSYAGIDENLMAREIALFVTASITTLTNQLCYCVHHVEEWIGERPEDEGRRTDGVFLSRALQESIRLHAGPVLMRKAASDQVLPSGEQVTGGHYAWVVIREASKDPGVFGADAESFNPFRTISAGALPYGVEFGVGRHTCIGKRFALGDDPEDPDALNGAGVTVMRRLYEEGMRLDPGAPRTFVPELLDVHASSPIILSGR
jgi:cytochrome P450